MKRIPIIMLYGGQLSRYHQLQRRKYPENLMFIAFLNHKMNNHMLHVYLYDSKSLLLNIDGSAQDGSNSIANAMELLQTCIKPSICNVSFYSRYIQGGDR